MAISARHEQQLVPYEMFVPGHSTTIQTFNAIINEIAGTSIPVLLIGESGTGKEVYARLIHWLSPYSHKPLLKLNCRSMESAEFVAQLKICLTRKVEDSSDHGQVVFLDGIDELDSARQKALLSLLPDGEHEKSGQDQVRLISSASRNLDREIAEGWLRKELFFRINGVCLRLPTLRERKEDIPLLLNYFLTKQAAAIHREIVRLEKQEFELLESYDWPGNVRELENFARKITLFGHVRDAVEELQNMRRMTEMPAAEPPRTSLKIVARTASRQAERELIREALERTHWNRKRAAEQLKISYKSLLYKIKQTGLEGR